ncbi:MAG TPA: MotA/TolQ/ExbB proton channel family protein [Spirochaetia bacterium]|nr:MotA/TolQ/ExbB proton channel family protein [Spirochaetia bacterium]
MFDLLLKGGPILWVILALAVPVLAILAERILYFRRIALDEDKLFARVKTAVEKGHWDEALAICDTVEAPLAGLIRAAVEHRTLADADLKEAVRDAAVRELPAVEHTIQAVNVIAGISPLMGLLGTVSGIINSFNVLGSFGAVSDPSVLAKGISEALLTTAAGIVIAVPSMVIYAWLAARANSVIGRLEGQANDLVRLVRKA